MSARRNTKLALVAVLSASCATEENVLTRMDVVRDALDAARDAIGEVMNGDSSVMDSGVDTGADTGVDTGIPGDSLPRDTVTFFTGTSCPMGWAPFTEGAGRVIVSAETASIPAPVRGAPLSDSEDRTHTHMISSTFALGDVSYVGASGGGNNGVASSAAAAIMARTEPASAGLPYVQLLVCRKMADPVVRIAPLPSGMTIHVAATRCPVGFTQPMPGVGRAVVGTVPGGENVATVGPVASPTSRGHTHPTNATLATVPHGIALASGCCASGYGRNATITNTAPTSEEDGALPSITLLQCQKD